MNVTLNQAGKYASIVAVILALVCAAASSLAWSMSQVVDYGTVKATVNIHTEQLKNIDSKLDRLLLEKR